MKKIKGTHDELIKLKLCYGIKTMTNAEIQSKINELKQQRDMIHDAGKRLAEESDTLLASIRNSVSLLKKRVEDKVDGKTLSSLR